MQRAARWLVSYSPGPVRRLWLRIRSSPIGHRVVKGAFWMVSGNVIARLLGLVGSILAARILGKVSFGELGTIQSTVGLFAVFAGFGIGITATKYVAEFREIQPKRCGRVIGFSLAAALLGGALASLGLLCFSDWLAAHTLADPALAPELRIGAAIVIFGSLQGAYQGALSGFEAFKDVCLVNLISSLISVPLLVLGALWDGLAGAVWALVLQMVLGCIAGHVALLKQAAKARVPISLGVHPDEWAMLWRFTLPAFLSTMLATPAGWFSRTLLVNQPGGYGESALVSAANQWMNLVNFLPWTIGGVLVPIFANLYASGQRDAFMKLLRRNLLLNGVVAAAIALPLAILSPIIMGLYGHGFQTRNGILIFVVTMFCGIVVSINNLYSRTMQSAGRAWIDLTSNGIWAAMLVAGSLVLIHPYKGLGSMEAYATAGMAQFLGQIFLMHWLFYRKTSKSGH